MSSFRAVLPGVLLAFGIVSLVAAVGCGTSGSPIVTNQSGNFSSASLSGSYVYELHGQGCTSNFSCGAAPYREMGVFTADGAGHIGKSTPGSDDISGGAGAVAVTGTYNILKDGTGSITMSSQLGPITLAITMVSNSKVYLTEADSGLVATGVAELQDSSAISSIPSGNFVFRVHQEINAQKGIPSSHVGFVSLSSGAGNGVMDFYDMGGFGEFNAPLTATLSAPGPFGRGTGTFVDNNTGSATINFIYYIVSNGKLDLLISDTTAVGSGSAEAQSGAVGNGLSGSYVFGSEGDDTNYLNGFAAVGQFTINGGVASGTQDTAQDGNLTSNTAFSACGNAPSAKGRVEITRTSNFPCIGNFTSIYWMVNPSRAFFLDLNSGIVDDGTADLQTGSSFSASTFKGQYAMVMGGLDLTVQQLGFSNQSISRVGAAQFDGSSKLTVNEEVNTLITSAGASSPGVLSGSYSVSSNGRIAGGVANFNNGGTPLDLVGYGVSGSKAYMLQSDSGLITSGTIELQQ